MPLFEVKQSKDISDIFLEIKYDGVSFDGTMNIADLANELTGLHYCLRSLILNLKYGYTRNTKDKELQKIYQRFSLDDIEILTEGFVNNCFLKRIRFKELLDEAEKRPELMALIRTLVTSGFAIWGVYITATAAANSEVLKEAFSEKTVPTSVSQYILNAPLDPIAREVALAQYAEKRFRQELAKPVAALRRDGDGAIFTSPAFTHADNNTVSITTSDREKFLLEDAFDSAEEGESVKFDIIEGRINSIDLDATKNQIGFKVANEGAEIGCHLIETLDVNDFKDYLGEWVAIEGDIYYDENKTRYIQIHKIEKISSPEESGQVAIE